MELHDFEYTPDHAQELNYYRASACRFFALARNGDKFRKVALNEFMPTGSGAICGAWR